MKTCRECGNSMQTSRENHRYTESGLPNVTLLNMEVHRCSDCGAVSMPIRNIEGLHRAIAFTVARQRARLSGAEIRFLRKHLGLSAEDFALTIGVTASTVSRWENEREPMGVVAERLLRLMALWGKPVAEYPLEKLREVAQDSPVPRISARLTGKTWETEELAA
jgi:putative zinc finger/helix-turn-helix YgiT family protein